MTKDALLKRLEHLSDEQFQRVAPYLEADLDCVESLDDLHAEIEEGRKSAENAPLQNAEDVYARVRKALGS